jgi:hypothetical protein
VSYLGSKGQAGVFQRIIGNMPPHSVYVEPFLGSGKILLTKRPAVLNVGIDADAGVIKNLSRILSSSLALGTARLICGESLALLPTLTLPELTPWFIVTRLMSIPRARAGTATRTK